MWGSTIPSIYYGFYCDPGLQKAYWANVSKRPFPISLYQTSPWTGNHPGRPLYSGHPPSQVPSPYPSPLPSSHVCRTWAVRPRLCDTRYSITRLDNAKPADECRLDGIDGNIQSDWGSDVCCSGLSSIVNSVDIFIADRHAVSRSLRKYGH